MKKFIFLLTASVLIFLMLSTPVKASDAPSSPYEEILINNNLYYVETVLTQSPGSASYSAENLQSKTATKTNYYRDADYNVLWSVSITATFYYDGESAVCTSCSHQTTSPGSTWSIKNASSSISGNTATATATATQTLLFGITKDYTQSVSISCAPDGTLS